MAVPADRRGLEPNPGVTDEHLDQSATILGVHVDARHSGVARGVDHGLARRARQGFEVANGEVAGVTHGHHVDGHVEPFLDLGGDVLEGGSEPEPGGRV